MMIILNKRRELVFVHLLNELTFNNKNYNIKYKDYKMKDKTQRYEYFSAQTQKSDAFVKKTYCGINIKNNR